MRGNVSALRVAINSDHFSAEDAEDAEGTYVRKLFNEIDAFLSV
jgi:hypothetical protein